MKVTFVVALLQALVVSMAMASAIPLPKASTTFGDLAPNLGAPCALHAHFDGSWTEGAMARYSVKATAEGVDFKTRWYHPNQMLEVWCEIQRGRYLQPSFSLFRFG
jgi:hypothetical protein